MEQGKIILEGERASWIKLNLLANLTPENFFKLLQYFKSATAVFEAARDDLETVLGASGLAEKIVNFSAFFNLEKEIESVEKRGVRILTLLDDGYPQALRSINCPPPVLYIEGDIHQIDQVAVAVVGSRTASPYGIMVAERIASQLAERGISIVSGFALGIDTAAHRGCLQSQGRTLAVLGCGLNRNYPASNYRLGRRIVENGAMISEFPMSAQPLPYHFPRRNRIISGLSLGTLVVEAAKRSGSLSTANHALEQNKEVFAVPGNINSRCSQGTNGLIKDGAKLVSCCEDIIEEIEPQLKHLGVSLKEISSRQHLELSEDENLITRILASQPKSVDEIIHLGGGSPQKVLGLLSQMEIKGIIRQSPGKIFSLD